MLDYFVFFVHAELCFLCMLEYFALEYFAFSVHAALFCVFCACWIILCLLCMLDYFAFISATKL